MMSRYFLHSLLPIVVCNILMVLPAMAEKETWKPVTSLELALKSPKVDKEADAEALFWEVYVEDRESIAVLSHYLRIKVFNDRGSKQQSTVDLPYSGKSKIEDVMGRTIKPDGTITELNNQTIYERTLIKAKGFKLQVKSFAMPAVEPGSLIEIRWRERLQHLPYLMRLDLQRDIPVHRIYYRIKPYAGVASIFKVRTYNLTTNVPLQQDKDGYFNATLLNVPAFRVEPQMPPQDQVRFWMLVYYMSYQQEFSFHLDYGKAVYEEFKSKLKINSEIHKSATELLTQISSPDKKLEALFEFCRSKVVNVDDQNSSMSAEEREKSKGNKSVADTLKLGKGTSHDINLLFAALATSAGFEARLALVGDRSSLFFNHNTHFPIFLNSSIIAVRFNNGWLFFDPGSLNVPCGMLRWQQEGEEALISDPRSTIYFRTPLSPPGKSLEKRIAKLQVNEDGTLAGEVHVEMTGHKAMEERDFYQGQSITQGEEYLRNFVKRRISTAEVSNIQFQNLSMSSQPFKYSYQVRVPNYAELSGKRLFLQPAYFQKGQDPLFRASTRWHQIYFSYPWSEEDDLTIEVPADFYPEDLDAPRTVQAGNHIKYRVEQSFAEENHCLYYRRSYMFGERSGSLVPAAGYSALKKIFDTIDDRDNIISCFRKNVTDSK